MAWVEYPGTPGSSTTAVYANVGDQAIYTTVETSSNPAIVSCAPYFVTETLLTALSVGTCMLTSPNGHTYPAYISSPGGGSGGGSGGSGGTAKSFTPTIYNEDNPIGFAFALIEVQKKLARCTLLEYIYGVAHQQYRLRSEKQTENYLQPKEGSSIAEKYRIYYPQGRKLGQDIDLSFNDACASSGFFMAKDPIDVNPNKDRWDWTDTNVKIAQPFSFIFFCNLQKLEVATYEEVKTALLYFFNQMPTVVITSMSENLESIWKEFTTTQQIFSFARLPYYCLRLEGVLTYNAFPFNGNSQFDPSIYDNPANEQDVQINANPGLANTN